MNLSEKVAVSTFSDVVITVVGFAGTLYFARTLGAGPLGTFALGLTVVQVFLVLDFGVGHAAMKRISADNEADAHFSAALLVYGGVLVGAVAAILLFRERVNAYLGGEFALIVAVIFAFQRLYQMLNTAIKGRNRVHVRDSIDAAEQLVRVGAQALLVFLGFRTLGLFLGYATSFAVAVLVASLYYLRRLSLSVTVPSRDHFRSLYEFSKYAWIGQFKSRALSWTDVTVMGFFVANSVIGVYQVAWTLAMTFQILAKSLGRNLFPEVSEEDSSGGSERVASLARQSFVFAGLLPIPGVVGAALLGDRVLYVYGAEFREGATILVVLAGVSLLRAYEGSVYSIANGVNRPRISFVSSLLFVVANVGLNVLLVSRYGAIGAAVATVLAVLVSLVVAYRLVGRHVEFSLPIGEVGLQVGAAAVMGVLVWWLESRLAPLSFPELLLVVGLGAGVYFALVVGVSEEVRSTVLDVTPRPF